MNSVTALLIDWRQGDQGALDRLIPLVYDELRRLARAQVAREAPGHALPATALVHEVYLRLIDAKALPADGRAHFLAIAARLMRQILVDHARQRRAAKRGAELVVAELDAVTAMIEPKGVDILALDDALGRLGALDPRQRDVVEMKFFGGLTIAEIAAALAISHATVEREWAMAKAFLHRELGA